MKKSFGKITNFSFGSTSAIITNISLIIGLGSGHVPKSGIIGGLLIIGIAVLVTVASKLAGNFINSRF